MNFPKAKSIWTGLSPREVWRALTTAPKTANEWQPHYSENQRVEFMFMRRTIQTWFVWDMDVASDKNAVAFIWGPTSSGQWLYKVPGQCRGVKTKEEAMATADKLLKQAGWLLVEEET